MATKSFMTDLTFDEKSADSLIQALLGRNINFSQVLQESLKDKLQV